MKESSMTETNMVKDSTNPQMEQNTEVHTSATSVKEKGPSTTMMILSPTEES
jgi:hypothetical protein